MIRPDKHLDVSVSVIYVGGLIIEGFKEQDYIRFDELLNALIRKTDQRVKAVFIPALSFLYLLGKIRYHQEIDSFELVKSA